ERLAGGIGEVGLAKRRRDAGVKLAHNFHCANERGEGAVGRAGDLERSPEGVLGAPEELGPAAVARLVARPLEAPDGLAEAGPAAAPVLRCPLAAGHPEVPGRELEPP